MESKKWTKIYDNRASQVYVSELNGIKEVVKRYGDYSWGASPLSRYKNEVGALKRLLGNKNFPQLKENNDTLMTVVTDWCGVQVKEDKPENSKEQADEMLSALKKAGIIHRDITPFNVLVSGDTLKLIDFEWAIYDGSEHSKKPFPPPLGMEWKDPKGFNDKYSLYKTLGLG